MTDASPDAPAEGLSDDAVKLCLGWFSFGAKGTVNISPPHENKTLNQAAIDELLAIGAIVHSHEAHRDIHTYAGTSMCDAINKTPRARSILKSVLGV